MYNDVKYGLESSDIVEDEGEESEEEDESWDEKWIALNFTL